MGKHVLMDGSGLRSGELDDLVHCSAVLRRAAELSGATVLGEASHQFEPSGVTVVLLLAESHISIHTYPERGAAMIDIFTCGEECEPMRAARHIREQLGGDWTIHSIHRGEV